MRSKEKTNTREEILRNFTREFLIEEKRRCEIDRYIADFRILIHKRPHENHNYLNRLLQDYTTIFLSHERISANKMNQENMKNQHKFQLASMKKQSPKQRYVKSKLYENDDNTEHQSYSVLKAKNEEFLRKLREYEKLQQLAYEIFITNSNTDSKIYQNKIGELNEPSSALKLKSSEPPIKESHKKHQKNIYVVNSPQPLKNSPRKNGVKEEQQLKSKNSENYEIMKRETENFLENNKKHNDAERKFLNEQYKSNPYIKKYVDNLTTSGQPVKAPQTPKRGIYSKLKNMIGLSPDHSTKFYKNIENNSDAMIDTTKLFLKNERKYNNFEFEAYKLFYIKNGEFQNPLIENIENIAYKVTKQLTESGKKGKNKHSVDSKTRSPNPQNAEIKEFENFNVVKCSPIESEKKSSVTQFQFDSATPGNRVVLSREQYKLLQENKNFLEDFKLYEEKQRFFYVIHMRKHPFHPTKGKKETFFVKIKQIFFGKGEKSKEKLKNLHEITQEFLKNEQYYYGLQKQAHTLFLYNDSNEDLVELRKINNSRGSFEKIQEKNPNRQTISVVEVSPSKKNKNKTEKSGTLKKQEKPSSLHQRSKSEDFLLLKKKTRSLENKKSPTSHKTFSERLKSMVGIGNRRKTQSRDNIYHLTHSVHDFLEHERYNYNGTPVGKEKYSRSFSAVEQTPKDGTIKTKTKKFLSTENVLYHDNKKESASKPPSGRRRNEKRNSDNKEKRRSRTLSPAQKLVTKFRNLVHKNNVDKVKDPKTSSVEITKNFISDHKEFNDALGNPDYTKSNKTHQLVEKAVDGEASVSNATQESPIISNSSNITERNLGTEPNNQFLKEQTMVFMDDIKNYHDYEREPDATRKTLIYVNNKENDSRTTEKPEITSAENLNEKYLMPKDQIANTSEKFEEKKKWIENSSGTKTTKEIYSAHTVTRKIIYNTVIQKTSITNKESTQSMHSSKKELHGTSIMPVTVLDDPSQSEHVYENVQFDAKNNTSFHMSKVEDDDKEHMFTIRKRNDEDSSQKEVPHKGKIEIETLAKSDNNQNKSIRGIESREKIIIPSDERKSFSKISSTVAMKIPLKARDGNVDNTYSKVIIEAPRTSADNQPENIDVKSAKQTAPEINFSVKKFEQSPKEEMNNQKSSASKLVTIVGKHKDKPLLEENNEIHLQQKQREKIGLKKQNPEQRNFHNELIEDFEQKVISENERRVLLMMRRNTDNFLKDHQDYHNKQRIEDIEFCKKVGAPETMLWRSSKPSKKKDSLITKVKNWMSPHQEEKPIQEDPEKTNKILRDQTAEFLKKHQYLIHKEETIFAKPEATKRFKKESIPLEKSTPSESKIKVGEKMIRPETHTVDSAEKQSSLPRNIEKSPEKETKSKKSHLSKLKKLVSGSSKKPLVDDHDIIIRQQTEEFLNDMRKHHDVYRQAISPTKILWLSEQKPKKQDVRSEKSEESGRITVSEEEKRNLLMIRRNTDNFLKDHQDYHNKQRIEDIEFCKKVGAPETMLWLSSKPSKKKDTLITKVKNWMSPHQENKPIQEDPEKTNKILRDQTAEFLKKHQYLIHKEETIFAKPEATRRIKKESIPLEKSTPSESKIKVREKMIRPETHTTDSAEKQSSLPRNIEKSPEKETKSKKSSLSKLKKLVSGSSEKPLVDDHDIIIRQQTGEFLNDMRKHHDVYRQAISPTKILWLSEQKPKKQDVRSGKSEESERITVSEEEKRNLLMIRRNTDNFLKDHQDYHNKQRIEDIEFCKKVGAPETMLWLSSKPSKKKDTLITKVKNWMSPHQENKPIQEDPEKTNKILRDQTAEFLKKHQYLIHKEETIFAKPEATKRIKKESIPLEKSTPSESKMKVEEMMIRPETYTVESAEKQSSLPRNIEKPPVKETKSKKSSLSKLKKLVSGSSKKPLADDHDIIIRQQTGEFINDMRKHNDVYRQAISPTKILWLSEQKPKKQDVRSEKSEESGRITVSEEEKRNLLMIRRNTDNFLKDHQDYHNKQRIEDIEFCKKVGAPETMLWLSSKPSKKKDTLITKVKNWMSPHQEKKPIQELPEKTNQILRDQTAEFLKKHQYLIHKEETIFAKPEATKRIKKESIPLEKSTPSESKMKVEEMMIRPETYTVESAEKQSSLPRNIEKPPVKETKSKKSSLSKLKKLVSGSSKKPLVDDHDIIIRQQTGEFLNDMRKHNDVYRQAISPTKILWLSEQKPKKQDVRSEKSEESGRITVSEEEKRNLLMIRRNTDNFLKDHQDYHNKQRIEDIEFCKKVGAPETMLWLSSKPSKKKDTLITKVKNWMSPHQEKKPIQEDPEKTNKILRDQTAEFLKKHQYLIHKEETIFAKPEATKGIKKESIPLEKSTPSESKMKVEEMMIRPETHTVESAEKQSSLPRNIEKSPEKETKSKKSSLSKLKKLVSGSSRKPLVDDHDIIIRQQTGEFLNEMRKHHDVYRQAISPTKILWLSEQKPKKQDVRSEKSEESVRITVSEEEKRNLLMIRRNTDNFLKDHQDYHNKQRIEDIEFCKKVGAPETMLWLSSKPSKNKDTLITKVKNWMYPHQEKKPIQEDPEKTNKILRDQTAEFLKKHQYLIHKEETIFAKPEATKRIKKESIPLEKSTPSESKSRVEEKMIRPETYTVESAEKQSALPRNIEKSPEKETKSKKSSLSKLKKLVSGSSKKPLVDDHDIVIRQQTGEFLNDMRKHHDVYRQAISPTKILWLSEQKPKKQDVRSEKSEESGRITVSEKEKRNLLMIRRNTDDFLKDHQNYHNKQRVEDIEFCKKVGAPETMLWLSSKPSKKKDPLITKVKNWMSPHQEKKPIQEDPEKTNKILRDQTAEFLKKHQYLIHKEETIFAKPEATKRIKKESIPLEKSTPSESKSRVEEKMIRPETYTVESPEKQSALPRNIEKSPEKETKSKKSSLSKLKKLVSGSSKKPLVDDHDIVIRQQTEEFLNDMRKHHDVYRQAISPTKILWLSEQKPKKQDVRSEKSEESGRITVSEEEKRNLLMIRRNTDDFLKDHQDYHNKQRVEDIEFCKKVGAPETMLWLSSKPSKKKDTLITKVKNWMSPHQEKKPIQEDPENTNKILRDQTAEFLKKHQYLIHKEETIFAKPEATKRIKKESIPLEKSTPSESKMKVEEMMMRPETHTVESAEKQSSLPRNIEKSPEKETKSKKSSLSKLKKLVSGSSKKPLVDDHDIVIRQQTGEFLNDMRKHHEVYRQAISPTKILWLSEQKPKEQDVRSEKSEESGRITVSEEEKRNLLMIRRNTDDFLKDHQDYHNKQRIEHIEFCKKVGAPETMLWLSSKPSKKKDTLITKVTNWMSPHQEKKPIQEDPEKTNKILRDQTAEFLKKHQYLIHKEETIFAKPEVTKRIKKESIPLEKSTPSESKIKVEEKIIRPETHTVESAEKQSSLPRNIEKSPEKETKSKKSSLSKLKKLVSGSSKKPLVDDHDIIIRQQTGEFLNDMRKHHDVYRQAISPTKILWLSEQKPKKQDVRSEKSEESGRITVSEEEKRNLLMIRRNTDDFLKDHQDYHNKQRIEHIEFCKKVGAPETMLWLSSKPSKKKDTLITKVKNWMSPHQEKNPIQEDPEKTNKLLRDQTAEFLKKHQYLIHKEETIFAKPEATKRIKKESIPLEKSTPSESKIKVEEMMIRPESHTVESAEKQSSLPRNIEKSPEKETKSKKSSLSKLKKLVSGSSKKPLVDDHIIIRQQTGKFLNDMRKHHDVYRQAISPTKILWLSEQKPKKQDVRSEKSEESGRITVSEEEKRNLLMIRRNTDNFLKDHQDYHNKQRIEDIEFCKKVGAPETMLWLSSKPSKKKDTLITKVKNWMSPHQEKKPIQEDPEKTNKILRDQTAEFLKKHQYLIHKEETIFLKPEATKRIKKESIPLEKSTPSESKIKVEEKMIRPETHTIESAEKQSSLPRNIEKSPEKETKSKKSSLSKFKKLVSGSSKKPLADDHDIIIRQQTGEFLNDMRKHHDVFKQAISPTKILWLSEQKSKKQNNPIKSKNNSPSVNSNRVNSSVGPNSNSDFSHGKKVEFLHPLHGENELYVDHKPRDSNDPIDDQSYAATSFVTKNNTQSNKPNVVPRKQKVPKKVGPDFVDAADIFRQNKQQFIIQETNDFLKDHINHQNNQWRNGEEIFHPTITERNVTMENATSTQYSENIPNNAKGIKTAADLDKSYFERRRALIMFLDDHLSHHEKERTSFITFISKQNKQNADDTLKKETKTKSKLMSKLKSLVSPSHENIVSDKKLEIENAKLRKQTLEFLISQKCYNDLEADACYKFASLKKKKQELHSNNDNKNHGVTSVRKEDSTFCNLRELSKDGSPDSKTQKPQRSSPAKKTSEMENITIQRISNVNVNPLEASKHETISTDFKEKSTKNLQRKNTPRKSSSQIENEKIDYEVTLHRTKVFLEDQKSFNDFLLGDSRKYVSQKNYSDFEIEKKGKNKDFSDKKEVEGSSSEKVDVVIKKNDNLFLEGVQDVDSEELLTIDNTSQRNQKNTKAKKGVISKIKALITRDSQKYSISTPGGSLVTDDHQNELDKKVQKEQDYRIQGIAYSPCSYKKITEENSKYPDHISREATDDIDSLNKSSVAVSEINPTTVDAKIQSTKNKSAVEINEKLNVYLTETTALNEKKKFACDKIKTHEFLLDQRKYSNITESEPKQIDLKNETSDIAPGENVVRHDEVGKMELFPTAPPLEKFENSESDGKNTVIHREVKPLSPTKTVFKEIRQRDESPDKTVYIMKEGYMITKDIHVNDKTKNDERKTVSQEKHPIEFGKTRRFSSGSNENNRGFPTVHIGGAATYTSEKPIEGRDSEGRSNDTRRSVVPQDDLEVRRTHTRNCYFIFLVILVVVIAILLFRDEDD